MTLNEEKAKEVAKKINELKIKSKHDPDLVKRLNETQRAIEERLGKRVVEFDPTYGA